MPNSVRNFPDQCDARQAQGGACFCTVGTKNGYPMPWIYRYEGSGFDGVFAWANKIERLVWFEQFLDGDGPAGCTWTWSEEIAPGQERGIALRWTRLIPPPVPPATVTVQVSLFEDNPAPPPLQFVVEMDIKHLEFPEPAVEPVDLFTVNAAEPPQPAGEILITPRRWDWTIDEPW